MSSIDDVLERVARGELTPDEALSLLEGEPGGAGPPEGDEDADAEPGPVRFTKSADPPPYVPPDPAEPRAADGPSGVRVIRVRTLARALEIYGDPSVAEVQVTRGSPSLRRDGDTLVVEHGRGGGAAGGGRYAFVTHLRNVATTFPGFDERTVLRVNPDLLIDVDVSATSLRVWGCEGGLRLRLGASSAKFDRLAGPLEIEAHSSSIKGTVRLTGESRIRCESSSLKLALLDGSDVKITSTNHMGKVLLPSGSSRTVGEGRGFAKVGAGTGLLDIDATMSSVTVGRPW